MCLLNFITESLVDQVERNTYFLKTFIERIPVVHCFPWSGVRGRRTGQSVQIVTVRRIIPIQEIPGPVFVHSLFLVSLISGLSSQTVRRWGSPYTYIHFVFVVLRQKVCRSTPTCWKTTEGFWWEVKERVEKVETKGTERTGVHE